MQNATKNSIYAIYTYKCVSFLVESHFFTQIKEGFYL